MAEDVGEAAIEILLTAAGMLMEDGAEPALVKGSTADQAIRIANLSQFGADIATLTAAAEVLHRMSLVDEDAVPQQP
jgi:hypothetical protein